MALAPEAETLLVLELRAAEELVAVWVAAEELEEDLAGMGAGLLRNSPPWEFLPR